MAKRYAAYAALAFGTFVLCGFLIAVASEEISQSLVGTYAVLGAAGVSMFAWPIFLIWSFQQWMRGRRD